MHNQKLSIPPQKESPTQGRASLLYIGSMSFLFRVVDRETKRSQAASRLGSTNRIRRVADRVPMEMVWQICPMVGSTGAKPTMPVTRMMIRPDVRIVWVEPWKDRFSDSSRS